MIQDISPSKLVIDYKNHEAKDHDKLIVFKENDILVLKEGDSEKTIDFPSVGEVGTSECRTDKIQFLFEVDEVKYYLYCQDAWSIGSNDKYKFINKRELFGNYDNVYGMIVFTAAHLHDWYENNKFCGRCGHKNNHKLDARALACPSCDLVIYPQINPVVIVAIHDDDKILLTKYAQSTYDRYALVAGFVEIGESFEEAVRREVLEEVGLKVKNIRYFDSQPWGITGGLMAGYFAELDGDNTVCLDLEELKEGTWLTKDEMPKVYENEKSLTRTMMYEWYKNY
ncbi:NAD(+) diphosphatase [Fusibacter sp. JL216-2]|uniref:NAD(+) diphosphatase n=1 Tax=Fusibacter sp. JL216-2 TaxID=3071453 RepID=UPI003D326B6A